MLENTEGAMTNGQSRGLCNYASSGPHCIEIKRSSSYVKSRFS